MFLRNHTPFGIAGGQEPSLAARTIAKPFSIYQKYSAHFSAVSGLLGANGL
jgi:hypothetical protein